MTYVKGCDWCQRLGTISRRHEMRLSNILEVYIFYLWGIDILVSVDYVSKWVEALTLLSNHSRVVIKFIKSTFLTRFSTPRAIICDGGNNFINNLVKNLLAKFVFSTIQLITVKVAAKWKYRIKKSSRFCTKW